MNHGTISTSYLANPNGAPAQRVAFKQNMILFYDDQNRVSSVYGYIPSLVSYPVLIIAQYGYDVFVDILGISAP